MNLNWTRVLKCLTLPDCVIERGNMLCPCYGEELLQSFTKDLFLQGKGNWSDYSSIFTSMTVDPPFTSLKYKITMYLGVFLLSKSWNGSRMALKKLWHSENILVELMHLYFLKRRRNFKGIERKRSWSWVNSLDFLKAFLKPVIYYLRS